MTIGTDRNIRCFSWHCLEMFKCFRFSRFSGHRVLESSSGPSWREGDAPLWSKPRLHKLLRFSKPRRMLCRLRLTWRKFFSYRGQHFLQITKNLAKVVAARRFDHPLIHWNRRKEVAGILQAISSFLTQIFYIKRVLNGVAHNCAKRFLGNP